MNSYIQVINTNRPENLDPSAFLFKLEAPLPKPWDMIEVADQKLSFRQKIQTVFVMFLFRAKADWKCFADVGVMKITQVNVA